MPQSFIPVDQNNTPLPAARPTDPGYIKLQNSSGTTIDPATSSNQLTANSSLATIAANTGLGATAAKQPALGALGTPSIDVLTVQGGAGMYPLTIAGATANTAASASNPFPVIPYASASTQAVFGSTNGDTLAGSATVNAQYVNAIGRIYNGSTFSRIYQITAALTSTGTGVAAVAIAPAASQNITSATTTTAKSGAGMLSKIIINTSAAGTITVYDSTSASGTKLATITAVASGNPVSLSYDIPFGTGLTIVTSASMDITVTFR